MPTRRRADAPTLALWGWSASLVVPHGMLSVLGTYLGLDIALKEVEASTTYKASLAPPHLIVYVLDWSSPNLVRSKSTLSENGGSCANADIRTLSNSSACVTRQRRTVPSSKSCLDESTACARGTRGLMQREVTERCGTRVCWRRLTDCGSIVSEYVAGGTLRQFIQGNREFPWRLRISFATDIARALAYLHAREVRRSDQGEATGDDGWGSAYIGISKAKICWSAPTIASR